MTPEETNQIKEAKFNAHVDKHLSTVAYSNSAMCQSCIQKYKMHYMRGEFEMELPEEEYEQRKENGTLPEEVIFPVSCQGDIREGMGSLAYAETEEEFALAGMMNPDIWFQQELGITLRWYQSDSAACTSRAKVDRWGRRCLPATEMVLMADGNKLSIKDIKAGMEVACTDTEYIYLTKSRVIETQKNGIQDIYKIKLEDGKQIRCTSNHPVLILDKEDSHWKWTTIREGLSEGDEVICLVDQKEGTYSASTINTIKKDGKEETYDITVDEFHNFIVDGIVTHNTGKTHHKVGDLLHKMQIGKGFDDNGRIVPERILVVAPYQAQIDEIFAKVDDMIDGSMTLKGSQITRRKSPNQVLILANRSRMTGFCVGSDQGSTSDKTRGQDATLIYSDEMDYMMDKDVESFMAIMASRADTQFWATSTPTGKHGKFYQFCEDKSIGFREMHLTAMESPTWNATTERILRRQYSQAAWEHEILANFGTVDGGVYPTKKLEASLVQYEYGTHLRTDDAIITIGVDWNGATNGNPIVVCGYFPKTNAYMVIDKYVSSEKEYTQIKALEDVVRMANKWHPNFIYLDAGFGNLQFELLQKHAQSTGNSWLIDKIKSIHMQGKVMIRDPITKQEILKQNKALMVDLTVQRVENQMCFFPQFENKQGSLVDQMRNYRIERYTPNGIPVYSQGVDHELVAWCLAMYAITMEFSDLTEIDSRVSIGYIPGLNSSATVGLDTQTFIKPKNDMEIFQKLEETAPPTEKFDMSKLAGKGSGMSRRGNTMGRSGNRQGLNAGGRVTGRRSF